MKLGTPHLEQLCFLEESLVDTRECIRALEAAQVNYTKIMYLYHLESLSTVREDVAEDVLRGLAGISLGKYGARGFSGLTQENADSMVDRLSGDVEEFFRPILKPR